MAIDTSALEQLEEESRYRREKVQRLLLVDGWCTKFVKGDAIMSIIVTFINLIGGVLVGMLSGMGDFNTIMGIYSTSTVGDGLVSQIPALLISVATGMVVTRSSSESTLAEDMSRQFLSQPTVLILTGVVLLFTIFIGFPALQVLILSSGLILLGILLMRMQGEQLAVENLAEEMPVEEITSEASYYRNVENLYELLHVEQIKIEFGYSLIPLVDEKAGATSLIGVWYVKKAVCRGYGFYYTTSAIKR